MRVAFIASEAVPFAKTGGLADVAGALPLALGRLGHSVSLFLPAYRQAREAGVPLRPTGLTVRVPVGAKIVEGRVLEADLPGPGATAFLIDQPAYFDRDELYGVHGVDYPDNGERFAFFDRAVLEAIRQLDLRPDIIHGNDWQTGLIPIYLEEFYREQPGFERVGTVLSIHNLAYQGSFPIGEAPLSTTDGRRLDVPPIGGDGRLNFLRAGLALADLLVAVSPTYAREIQTPDLGCGLDGLLRARSTDLRGVINGIDRETWDPATDQHLAARYDLDTVDAGKAACKADLQRRAGLPVRADVPLLAQIGRLVPEKGWEILADVADDLLRIDVQLVVLGAGRPRYPERLERLARGHPNKFRAFLGFDDPMAHRIEAGADLYLMPSLYEPCGLNQLYSLAYGTVPVVRRTGGLADTVVDATPEALADGTATGFSFREDAPPGAPADRLRASRARALRQAIDRALALRADRDAWSRLVRAGMAADWSWDRGARSYTRLYGEVARRRAARVAV